MQRVLPRKNHILTLFVALIFLSQSKPAEAAPQYRYTLSFTFENRGSKVATLDRDDVAVPLFRKTQWQDVSILSSTPPLGGEYRDEDGNNYTTPNTPLIIQPGSTLSYTVVYEINSQEKPRPQIDPLKAGESSEIPPDLVKDYTASSRTFPADDPNIADAASEITREEPFVLGKIVRLVRWLNTNITYDNYEVPRFAEETFSERRGDCDDQSILLITMLRSMKIPAYLEIGVVFDRGLNNKSTIWDGHLNLDESGVGWHGWVMAYIPPWGWLPVDLTLINEQDPLEVIRKAPEFGGNIVSSNVISLQDYVGEGRATRQRIISSTIFIESKGEAAYPATLSFTSEFLAVASILILGLVVMVYFNRRSARRRNFSRF